MRALRSKNRRYATPQQVAHCKYIEVPERAINMCKIFSYYAERENLINICIYLKKLLTQMNNYFLSIEDFIIKGSLNV